MNDENDFPLVEIPESQVEKALRRVLILGANSVHRGQIMQILSVVDQKKDEIGRNLSGDEVVEIARELVLVREEFIDPSERYLIEFKRLCEEEKESYLREIEGSFKVQKKQKFKSPSWNF